MCASDQYGGGSSGFETRGGAAEVDEEGVIQGEDVRLRYTVSLVLMPQSKNPPSCVSFGLIRAPVQASWSKNRAAMERTPRWNAPNPVGDRYSQLQPQP